MAQKFKLIERRNLGKDNEEVPRKYYAQAVNNGYVAFDELCGEIADKNLKAGRIVQFGEIGNFRLAVGSAGAATTKEFSTSLIKKPKIVFTPGSKLQTTRTLTSFERISEGADDGDGDGGEEERPGEL